MQYLDLVPAGFRWDRRVSARFVLDVAGYSPGDALDHVSVPVLVQVGSLDATTPAAAAVKDAERAPFL
jgi:hypothetical protein